MLSFKLNQVLFLFIFHGYDCQRRIKDGSVVTEGKQYVVYLLKPSVSPRFYDGWLCGGTLVSEEYIVTSAACVTDVTHLYAVAGYSKYIRETELYTDPCTKDKKKKIIFICTPTAYELVYTHPEKWSNIDIAVAKVESPYDFKDTSYAESCSYTPAAIEINYDPKYQEAGVDAMVLGWGHSDKYREETDTSDHNQPMLHYAATLIEDKEECKKEYKDYVGMDEVIDKYMICTNLKGNLNDVGEAILASLPTAQGCTAPVNRLRGELSCENDGVPGDQIVLVENSRKDIKPTNFSSNDADKKSNHLNSKKISNVVNSHSTYYNSSLINKINKTASRRSNTRRSGICQNDHGGPLVTWVGSHVKLIGVASAYKITESRECIGPYLYTSTQCNGAFLDCILRGGDTLRRALCDSILKEKGLKLVETHISWEDHPDGPAENERNGTTPVSAVNTTDNVTAKRMTYNEERNKTHQEPKATRLANTNITNTHNTTTTHSTIDTNLTKTTKAENVGDSTPMNLININSTNFKKSATTDPTTTKATSTKYQTNTSKSNIENTVTTILVKNATTNTNLRNTTTNIITELIKNATLTTINPVDTTSKN